MVSKHCTACGTEAHPKRRHPSSLRTEGTIWVVAISVGLVAGTWSAATSPSAPPLSHVLSALTLSSEQSIEQPQTAQDDVAAAPSLSMQLLTWTYRKILDFVRTAWWVLPIPILFSLWRQFRPYEVCAACGSRDLEPIAVPHGDLPPQM